jgi:sarcosine oxidase subunit beta
MDVDTGAVFYPEDAETMITSGPQETMPKVDPDRNQKEPSTEWTIETLENLSTLSDYFGDETRVQSPISGVYAQTPDSNPIIDEPIPGFVTAIGFSGHGFMHAPATGQVVSELILDGVASLTDIAPFSTQRFASEKSETEQSFI